VRPYCPGNLICGHDVMYAPASAQPVPEQCSDDPEATAGDSGWRRSRFRAWIICETCKEMHIGTQESYVCKDESLCTSLVLKCGV
jgi:hypothetical protein